MVASTARRFNGGGWDLRKDERRKNQVDINFPERRKEERRFSFAKQVDNSQSSRNGFDSNLLRMR